MSGNLIVSLDFELFWGVSETRTIDNYRTNLKQTSEVIDRLLILFKNYNIEVTWACVGFLFFEDKFGLKRYTDRIESKPCYQKRGLSNYDYIQKVLKEDEDLYLARDILKRIASEEGQEIASHTFSHFYTLESGTDKAMFREDMLAFIDVANELDLSIESIVFPRNQYDQSILNTCTELGIKAYRGNSKHFIYRPSARQGILRRGLRLLDAYLPLTGSNTYLINEAEEILNIRASRFLRPFNPSLKWFENLRIKRVLNEMNFAAKNDQNYHLWWHPHNFGADLDKNLEILERILSHYKWLNSEFGFESRNMRYFVKKRK